MNKIASGLLLVSVLAGFALFPVISLAQETPVPPAPDVKPIEALHKITNIAFTVLLIFAALMIIIAGYQFVTAGGDAGKVTEARNKVLYALVGVAVALIARGLVTFVETQLK